MHRRNVPWRRLAFALAVPVVAVGAVALTAGAAASSSGAATAVQTEQPNQPNQQPVNPNMTGNPNIPNQPPGTNLTIPRTLRTVPPTTGTASKTKTASPTKTPSGRPSVTISPSPSPSPGAPGGVVIVPVPIPAPGGGTAAGSCPVTMTPPVTIQVGTAGGKQALVNQAGCALYLFNKDTPQTSACDATCLQLWTPVPAPAQAGSGVNQSKLGTFNRTDGTQQATYGGHQLYTFAGDPNPGDANGQNVLQSFFLVDANGNAITP
jgi:predicted lipoprotein with Yx(FWY)xxD motif